jgi:hypothetical protein
MDFHFSSKRRIGPMIIVQNENSRPHYFAGYTYAEVPTLPPSDTLPQELNCSCWLVT